MLNDQSKGLKVVNTDQSYSWEVYLKALLVFVAFCTGILWLRSSIWSLGSTDIDENNNLNNKSNDNSKGVVKTEQGVTVDRQVGLSNIFHSSLKTEKNGLLTSTVNSNVKLKEKEEVSSVSTEEQDEVIEFDTDKGIKVPHSPSRIKKLLSVGTAFRVDPNGSGGRPAMAKFANDNLVFAWDGLNNALSSTCVYACPLAARFDSSGNPIGSVFQVSTHVNVDSMMYGGQIQQYTNVAVSNTGSVFFAWSSLRQMFGNNRWYVLGRFYDSSFNPGGSEFLISSASSTTSELLPSIAHVPSLGFVVSWYAEYPGTAYAQLYNANNGSPIGSIYTAFNPANNPPIVLSGFADGGYRIVSMKYDAVSVPTFILQRYNSANSPVGSVVSMGGTNNLRMYAFDINPLTATRLANDNIFIADFGYNADYTESNIYGQYVDSSGNALTGLMRINDYTSSGYKTNPAATGLSDGSVIVIWSDNRSSGPWGRRLDSSYNPINSDFAMNALGYSDYALRIQGLANGNFAAVWNRPVYAEIFNPPAQLQLSSASTLTYFEGASPLLIDAGIMITGTSNNMLGASVAITGNFNVNIDGLFFTNQNGIVGNYNNNTGILSLTGSSGVNNYQIALRSVTFGLLGGNPGVLTRAVSFAVNNPVLSNAVTRLINVVPASSSSMVPFSSSSASFSSSSQAFSSSSMGLSSSSQAFSSSSMGFSSSSREVVASSSAEPISSSQQMVTSSSFSQMVSSSQPASSSIAESSSGTPNTALTLSSSSPTSPSSSNPSAMSSSANNNSPPPSSDSDITALEIGIGVGIPAAVCGTIASIKIGFWCKRKSKRVVQADKLITDHEFSTGQQNVFPLDRMGRGSIGDRSTYSQATSVRSLPEKVDFTNINTMVTNYVFIKKAICDGQLHGRRTRFYYYIERELELCFIEARLIGHGKLALEDNIRQEGLRMFGDIFGNLARALTSAISVYMTERRRERYLTSTRIVSEQNDATDTQLLHAVALLITLKYTQSDSPEDIVNKLNHHLRDNQQLDAKGQLLFALSAACVEEVTVNEFDVVLAAVRQVDGDANQYGMQKKISDQEEKLTVQVMRIDSIEDQYADLKEKITELVIKKRLEVAYSPNVDNVDRSQVIQRVPTNLLTR